MFVDQGSGQGRGRVDSAIRSSAISLLRAKVGAFFENRVQRIHLNRTGFFLSGLSSTGRWVDLVAFSGKRQISPETFRAAGSTVSKSRA